MTAPQKGNRTIRGRLITALLVFNFLLTVAFASQIYFTQRTDTLAGIDRQLIAAARGIAYVLPDNFHEQWLDSARIADSVYVPLSRELQRYADSSGIDYVYGFFERDKRIVFSISSNTDSQITAGNFVGFGKPYDEASEALKHCFESGGTVVEATRDEYGSWRSALLRKKTPGGTPYVLGADIDVRHVDRLLRATLVRSAIIGLLGFLVLLLVTVKIANSITVPLVRLEQQTHQIIDKHFDIEKYDTSALEAIWKRFRDESGRLAFAFLTMLKELADHIKKLERETALRNRAESEMKLAGEIQRNYLPGPLSDTALLARVDLVGSSKPARQAGGDLFDYIALDDNRVVVAIGDVSDKGMAAAMFMAISVTLFRDAALRGLAPAEIAAAVNTGLARHNDLFQFLTFWFGIIDLDTGVIDYVNAGHNPPYLRRAGGAIERIADRSGPAMGVAPEAQYVQKQISLNAGDTLLLYTDGVTEAFSGADKLYSEIRLEAFCKTLTPTQTASAVTLALWDDVARFVNGAEQSDDITTLVVKLHGAP